MELSMDQDGYPISGLLREIDAQVEGQKREITFRSRSDGKLTTGKKQRKMFGILSRKRNEKSTTGERKG